MAKKLFGGVRTQLVGTLVAAVGGLALTACNCCNPSPVYKRPCCSQSGAPMYAPQYGPSYGPAPAGAPMMAPRSAAPSAPQMNCGAGKCA